MKKECIAMLLAGGQGSRLYVLTQDMAKPAVPFGGGRDSLPIGNRGRFGFHLQAIALLHLLQRQPQMPITQTP